MVLDQILKFKRKEVERQKRIVPVNELRLKLRNIQSKPKSLYAALKNSRDKPHLICEAKKASPSKGIIRNDFDPVQITKTFNSAGATAISVLTDQRFFQGNSEIFYTIRSLTKLPVLRKDFIVDSYQVVESKLMGADCILLIVAALSQKKLEQLLREATKLKLECLVEIHNAKELKTAIKVGAKIIGINNRNLKNLKVNVGYAQSLVVQIPKSIARVVESGINSARDIKQYEHLDVDGFLVGTSLMKSKNIDEKIKSLRQKR